jgi:sugar lactone lactonase YvrE
MLIQRKVTGKPHTVSFVALARGLLLALALCAYFAAPAAAEVEWLSTFGSKGSTGGTFNRSTGLAINDETEHVYVADRLNNRIQEFDSAGNFLQTWGFDVVSTGPDNKPPADEEQKITVAASSGSFRLTFGGFTTEPLAYNAAAATVAEKLELLPSIGAGNVSVSGGPGDATGSSPYIIDFVGALAGANQGQITITALGLGVQAGETLACVVPETIASFTNATSIDYQWLANGQPISGATSPEYTVAAGDAGKALQCLATAHWPDYSGTTSKTNNDYTVASPAPGTEIPHGPADLGPIGTSAPLKVPDAGQILTCNSGAWSGSPTLYTYRWYRNGTQIATNQSSEPQGLHETTVSEMSSSAYFQCSVTAQNAGGSSTVFSQLLSTTTSPGAATTPSPRVTTRTSALTPRNGGASLEVCKPGDVCKAGIKGGDLGEFAEPRGVAVDNSPGGEGAIYVQDDENYRIQKFTSSLEPVLTFGREVNKTTGGKICVAATGDVCGAGVKELNPTPGEFGGWNFQNGKGQASHNYGNDVAVDAMGNVYVGTDNNPNPPEGPFTRTQKFTPEGAFLGQALVPSLTHERPEALSVAADSTGRAYTATGGETSQVDIFEPAEFTETGEGTSFLNHIWPSQGPRQLAIDPRNDRLLIGDHNTNQADCGVESTNKAIVEFDNEEHLIDCTVTKGSGVLKVISGLAVSPAGTVYASDWETNVVKIYKLPEETPPAVGETFVGSITQNTARVHTEIEPGFEATSFAVEVGEEACPGSCEVHAVPDRVYGLGFQKRTVQIEGLEAGTTYHYRVVAENPLGAAEFADGTFTTYPFVDQVNDDCPNALARKQTRTVGLLDCRAYELASAASTGGYDVRSDLAPGQVPFEGRPDASGKLLYSVVDGGIPGTGDPTNRGPDPYVATRIDEGTNAGSWTTRYLGIPADNPFASSPFSSTLAGTDSSLGTFAFASSEAFPICSPCFEDGSSGIPVRMPNGQLVQGMVGDGGVADPQPAGLVRKSLSEDGSHLVFGSEQEIQSGGHDEDGDVTIYERNLAAGTTEVVSTNGAGSALSGEVGELDLSRDGSRVLVGTEASSEAGNTYWHLYLHLSGRQGSVDLMPSNVVKGALFDGMTADGSRVFLSTTDKLLGSDSDENVDIYEAKVTEGGTATLRLVSVGSGGPSNDESCEPPGKPDSWNTAAGEDGKCNALAFAGGAGVGSDDGTFYFLSPELLDAAAEEDGEGNQPNLYLVRPGQSPEFVATIDSSAGKTVPPPEYPVANESFGGAMASPLGLAVDQSNGDVYVAQASAGKYTRFDSSGSPHNFTAGPGAGTNAISAGGLGGTAETAIGVDNASGSPFNGDFYAKEGTGKIAVYKADGEKLGELSGFSGACGLAVDQSNGDVYVGDYGTGEVRRFTPVSGTTPVSKANYTETRIVPEGVAEPCQVAADTNGHVYVSAWPSGPAYRFEASAFAAVPPTLAGVQVTSPALAMYVDPGTDELYVNQGTKIAVFAPGGGEEIRSVAEGQIFGSSAVAVNSTSLHFYANSGSNVVDFERVVPPFIAIDNPAVIHAAKDAGTHHYGDFQVSNDGRYALFATRRPLDEGYENQNHAEVYRFDADSPALDCVSCLPSEAAALTDSGLPAHGLGLLNDGRVFFNSAEQLVLRDQNRLQDAYEWKQGTVRLISTGVSPYDSGLLSVSRDGKDAFFFTREQLVSEDENELGMRVYDAREEGGVFVIPTNPPCAASDECHGPGTVAALPPQIGTFKGVGGQFKQQQKPKCRKGFQARKVHGKWRCVKVHKRRHPQKHKRHSSRAVARIGAGGNR